MIIPDISLEKYFLDFRRLLRLRRRWWRQGAFKLLLWRFLHSENQLIDLPVGNGMAAVVELFVSETRLEKRGSTTGETKIRRGKKGR